MPRGCDSPIWVTRYKLVYLVCVFGLYFPTCTRETPHLGGPRPGGLADNMW